jgi:hypothetical protein
MPASRNCRATMPGRRSAPRSTSTASTTCRPCRTGFR